MTNLTIEREKLSQRKAAMARLRDLVTAAGENLPTETINQASYRLAVYLDVACGHRDFTAKVSEELANEQAASNHPKLKLVVGVAELKAEIEKLPTERQEQLMRELEGEREQ